MAERDPGGEKPAGFFRISLDVLSERGTSRSRQIILIYWFNWFRIIGLRRSNNCSLENRTLANESQFWFPLMFSGLPRCKNLWSFSLFFVAIVRVRVYYVDFFVFCFFTSLVSVTGFYTEDEPCFLAGVSCFPLNRAAINNHLIYVIINGR